MGFGGQIGAEITDFVVVLNNATAVRSFATGGNVTLGGNLSVAAGPIGRTAEAGASASTKSVAAIYSYSKSKGLFAGKSSCSVSIEGSVIAERKDANEAFYRQRVSASELLSGSITPPPQADILYRALSSRASDNGSYGHRRSDSDFDSNHSSPTSPSVGGVNRSISVSGAGRYGGSAGANRNFSNTSSYKHGGEDYSEDPVPRYSTSSIPAVGDVKRPFGAAGRASLDNGFNSSSGFNPTGPRVPPRISAKPETVTALYDFAGEQATDLAFKKGDIITVVKKTESKNDWWTGRCNGREGSFPANYTQ
ncbi:hypothetical protein BGW38_010462 [Lunasporangiospora selenospora]|uniref:SH3 domain-containing protein n=1 Tax=Lunasporangiospora selenospora TaxID=979761 RepID=A0A9P6KFP5_9FUNG|nr:hypothetical protein BGW38_010462 [Lunasporangiospora selenospora]